MATIAENLQTLNETKTAIKTAIENKGQNMTDVPFTSYADKITAIEGVSKADAIKQFIDLRKSAAYLFAGQDWNKASEITDDVLEEWLKYDTTENARYMGSMFLFCTKLTKIPPFSTKSLAKDGAQKLFGSCYELVDLPMLDLSVLTSGIEMFITCSKIVTVPVYDTSKMTIVTSMFWECHALKIVPALDFRSCTGFGSIFYKCKSVEEIWIKNIKANIQVGSGSTWGHLLTQESALSLCFQCRNTGATKTITFAAPVFDNLATLYVKYVEITDEMRADDDLIDEKYPFVLCESTDEGAMTIATYMTNKMWAIARG